MVKITTDFAGGESIAVTKTRLDAILSAWGRDTSGYATWGDAREYLDGLLIDGSTGGISPGEKAAVFRPKINLLNNPILRIADLFNDDRAGVMHAPLPGYVFSNTAGTLGAALGGTVARVNSPVAGHPHLLQATAAARPVWGRYPASGFRNVAMGSAAFGNATYWPQTPSIGLTITHVGSGVIGGEPYVDIRFNGTSTLNETRAFFALALSRRPASAGQTFTSSVRLSVVGGTTANVTGMRANVTEETAPGTLIGSTSSTSVTSGTATLVSATRTLSTGDQVTTALQLVVTDGAAIDVTYRIRGFQFEEGSARTAYQTNLGPYDVTEAGQRPLYYLQGDGVDDTMATNATVNLVSASRLALFAGLEKLTEGVDATFVGHGAISGGRFSIPQSTANARWRGRFVGPLANVTTAIGYNAPDRAVLNYTINRLAQTHRIRYNATGEDVTAALTAPSAFQDATVQILSDGNGAEFANARWFGHTIRDFTGEPERNLLEQYHAILTGVTL